MRPAQQLRLGGSIEPAAEPFTNDRVGPRERHRSRLSRRNASVHILHVSVMTACHNPADHPRLSLMRIGVLGASFAAVLAFQMAALSAQTRPQRNIPLPSHS